MTRDSLLEIISNNTSIRNKLSFKEHLELYDYVTNLSEINLAKLIEEVEPPETNPKLQKFLTMGLAAASLLLPVPGLTAVVLYATDINMYKCRMRCEKEGSSNKELCYRKCKYLATKWAVKWVEGEIKKCSKTKTPFKCQKKLFKLLKAVKLKETKEEIIFKQKQKEANWKASRR